MDPEIGTAHGIDKKSSMSKPMLLAQPKEAMKRNWAGYFNPHWEVAIPVALYHIVGGDHLQAL
ncbi:hypothetical protein E2542_SST30009 [Spatholobus suberectus]|nr:hypothetical protein E2542_SST30009 [Spatholobus suberectus]